MVNPPFGAFQTPDNASVEASPGVSLFDDATPALADYQLLVDIDDCVLLIVSVREHRHCMHQPVFPVAQKRPQIGSPVGC
jgi:hypothetical protein